MASFLQLAHHCFFLVSSTACCFSDSVCFLTSATNRSLSCSRLCLISAIVSSVLKRDKVKASWNSCHVWKGKNLSLCDINEKTGSVVHQLPGGVATHSWKQETYQDCASSLTALADAATAASQSLSLTVESVAKIQRWNLVVYYCDTLISISLYASMYLCNCVSWCAFGKVIVDFSHCPFYCVHDLQSFNKNMTLVHSLNYFHPAKMKWAEQ